jgi:hypothetical protein
MMVDVTDMDSGILHGSANIHVGTLRTARMLLYGSGPVLRLMRSRFLAMLFWRRNDPFYECDASIDGDRQQAEKNRVL